MFHEISHGLISLRGNPPLFVGAIQNVQVQPKLMVIGMSGRCSDTSPRNIPAYTSRRFGFAIASIIILIGTIANRTASFLTSIETSLLSWKSNSGILFAPGSKFGLSMSLWLRKFLGRIGNTPPAKSPPTTIPPLSFPSRSIILHGSPRSDQGISASISYERGI